MSYLSVIQITLLIIIPGFTNGFIKLGYRFNHLLEELNDDNFDLSDVEEKWIKQPLDHFNSKKNRTFNMRYFQNLDLWKTNGPIYISIGGEDEASPYEIASIELSLIGQLARDTNGALFATEHRYYGKKFPDISSYDPVEYYKFLSSQQALADIAYLIMFLKSDRKYKSSKVVVVGGSYAGNLATWMRELYPDLVDAAVAASAPVLAKKDFSEYLDIVRYTFGKYGGKNCLNNLEKTFRRYEVLLKTNDGTETLKKKLNICPESNLTVLENQQLLFSFLYYPLMDKAQYGTSGSVRLLCSKYNKKSAPSLSNSKSERCITIDFNSVKYTEPWMYQVCNEFGYLQTTNSEKQPFVHWIPLEYYLKYCKYLVKGDIEKKMDEGVASTNKMYGGRTPNVSKVVFTHGDMDPWRALGVQHDLSPDTPVTIVNGTSHCAVLCADPHNEPKQLTENREHVKTLIKKWIGL